jgi:hypothetical protein
MKNVGVSVTKLFFVREELTKILKMGLSVYL